ncbi:FxsA family protein [Helicobacter ailurogastricus]|uniref:FxsA protein n=1 Tax=Helicobacter ailurogastricus TaxID=1578720 RepID=A0A0K2Y3A9_9HELI|nr:FxsA family protein [Helicobacter ailurogastricus]BDQ29435.1 hypothetical protein ASB7_12720 [Helicobacter ailurogastricus]CRF52309.1 hypothetical protein HAL07_04350 [Helicobacter ailurogastricus]
MPILVLLGLGYLAFEIYLVVQVVASFGVFAFLFEVAASALLGGVMLFKSPFQNLTQLMQERLNPISWAEGVFLRSVGGVLLLLPGVLCDIFGLLLLLIASVRKKDPPNSPDMPDIIDVEVSDKKK